MVLNRLISKVGPTNTRQPDLAGFIIVDLKAFKNFHKTIEKKINKSHNSSLFYLHQILLIEEDFFFLVLFYLGFFLSLVNEASIMLSVSRKV